MKNTSVPEAGQGGWFAVYRNVSCIPHDQLPCAAKLLAGVLDSLAGPTKTIINSVTRRRLASEIGGFTLDYISTLMKKLELLDLIAYDIDDEDGYVNINIKWRDTVKSEWKNNREDNSPSTADPHKALVVPVKNRDVYAGPTNVGEVSEQTPGGVSEGEDERPTVSDEGRRSGVR